VCKYPEKPEDVQYFNYSGSMITNDERCEIKSRTATAKAALDRKRTLFISKLDLNLRKKLVKCYNQQNAQVPDRHTVHSLYYTGYF
jgi:hypothetical protein